MKTLEATKLAKDLPKVLDKVFTRHESFEIVQEGIPCAHLVPAENHCDSHEFADDIAGEELSHGDRRLLAADLRAGSAALKPLKNPWG